MAEKKRTEGLPPPPPHFAACTADVDPEEVAKSQKEFPWRVTDWNDDRKWVDWPALGLNVKESFGTILWKEMADQEHMFTGVAKLLPGAIEPCHIHDPPMVYYILEGTPIVELNGIPNKTRPGQCVTIPGLCPHRIVNPEDAPTALWIWCYTPPTTTVNKHHLNWAWKEEVEEK